MNNLYQYIPTIDLHGLDRDYARIKINEFIEDHYKLKTQTIIIVHGIGAGILKQETQKVLKINKYVEQYKLDNFNVGQTIVKLKKNI